MQPDAVLNKRRRSAKWTAAVTAALELELELELDSPEA